MTARGAADFLTRATAILGAAFVVLSIVLAAIAGGHARKPADRHLARAAPVTAPTPRRHPHGPGAPLAQEAPPASRSRSKSLR